MFFPLKVGQELLHWNSTSLAAAVWSLSHVWLFVALWTAAHQAPLSMGFPRLEYWSGLPYPSSGDLSNPGTEPTSSAWQEDSLPLGHWEANSFHKTSNLGHKNSVLVSYKWNMIVYSILGSIDKKIDCSLNDSLCPSRKWCPTCFRLLSHVALYTSTVQLSVCLLVFFFFLWKFKVCHITFTNNQHCYSNGNL